MSGYRKFWDGLDWMQPGMVIVDLETTGLDPEGASAFDVCAVNWRGEWIHSTHRPRPGSVIEPKALEVNGRDLRALDAIETPYYTGMYDVLSWLQVVREEHGEALILAGMNVHFDARFLKAAWADIMEPGTRTPVSHRTYDLHTLAVTYLSLFTDTPIERLYSDSISEALKIPVEKKPHTALRGCEWAAEAFGKIHGNLNKLKGAL